MAKIVEGQLPYTGGTGIDVSLDKVISILLREENNLIEVNEDNELYTDLQLATNITPSSDFPVGVTVGKVLEENGWSQNGLVLNRKTTSGDYARWLYGADGKIYFDGGQGTWKQVYYSEEVNALFTALRGELATVAFTGDYNDLLNRPQFLQIQSDWNQTDSDSPDYIKNKPTIPVVNDAILTIQKNGVTVGTFTANSNTNATANITVPNVINNLTSTSTGDSLSAAQGKELNDKITTLQARGRFLSNWNASTGLPVSFPEATPYNYRTGDYFDVTVVGSSNKKPDGVQYTGAASTTAETEPLAVGDTYIFDGTTWLLQLNHNITTTFATISGQPSDNANLASALNAKANTADLATVSFSGSYNDLTNKPTIPSGQVNSDWNANSGVAEILNKPTIPSKTSQLTNDSGYITSSSIPTIPSNVSAFNNDAGYITSSSLPGIATSTTEGLVKLGSDTKQTVAANTVSSEGSRTYAVQLNNLNQMVVNVPRTDTIQAIDSQLDSTSLNPVQNAVITNALASVECITKIFTLSSLSDLTTAQAAYDYLVNGGISILKRNGYANYYFLSSNSGGTVRFTSGSAFGYENLASNSARAGLSSIAFEISGGSVTSISANSNNIRVQTSAPSSSTTSNIITFVTES